MSNDIKYLSSLYCILNLTILVNKPERIDYRSQLTFHGFSKHHLELNLYKSFKFSLTLNQNALRLV